MMKCMLKYFLLLLLNSFLAAASYGEVILHDTLGKEVSFSSLKGKWVFINYWAGWCETCVAEIPEFNHFYQKHQQDKVALFAVNYDALPAVEQNVLIKKLGIRYPNLLKDPGPELSLEDIPGVPVTFVFNPEGKLVKTLYGGQSSSSLEKAIF